MEKLFLLTKCWMINRSNYSSQETHHFLRRMISIVGVFLLLCSFYAGIDAKTSPATVRSESNIKTIKNPDTPLKATIIPKLTIVLKIEPGQYTQIDLTLISDAFKDTNGNIYLLDGKNCRIHKFNASGKYQTSFLSRGTGPGELNQYPSIFINQNSLYAHGFNDKKIIRFDLEGKLLSEKKFLRLYRNPIIISDAQFIACETIESTENPIKRIGLYSLDTEKLENVFMDSKARGRLFIPFGKSRTAVEPEVGIIPDTMISVDLQARKCYIALNNEYKIYRKDFSGNTEIIIKKGFQPIELSNEDKNSVISNFGDVPAEAKAILLKVLPDKMCAFRGIDILSGGYLAVERFSDYGKHVLDIFDENGRFVYVFQPPEIKGLKVFKIFRDKLIAIVEEEDSDIYIEYRIDNLPKELF
ncbi:MAG: hypothetical protein QG657_4405 [Acidobacteriota bacterium]|nr:hypothetical protein [Acidobacteriota bacterium]